MSDGSNSKINSLEAALERALRVQEAQRQLEQTSEPVDRNISEYLTRLFRSED